MLTKINPDGISVQVKRNASNQNSVKIIGSNTNVPVMSFSFNTSQMNYAEGLPISEMFRFDNFGSENIELQKVYANEYSFIVQINNTFILHQVHPSTGIYLQGQEMNEISIFPDPKRNEFSIINPNVTTFTSKGDWELYHNNGDAVSNFIGVGLAFSHTGFVSMYEWSLAKVGVVL